MNYDHLAIESKWRKGWESSRIYETAQSVDPQNKLYVLPQLPYPSGAGLHMGHTEVYTGCDIYSRFMRMQGKDVLQVVGWDSFGLPAENHAIKTNVHPRLSTNNAIDNFREQIKSLGVSVDWSREVGSHNPDYYKWTQWFFKLMYKQGLAYREKQVVNWCPNDKTVLANEQVIDNKCERCGAEIELKEMEQWYFRITKYAQRLYEDLDKVDWPEESVKRQRDWIGMSKGLEVTFDIFNQDGQKVTELPVYTTAHETIYGATFIVLAPEHALLSKLNIGENTSVVNEYVKQAAQKTELERQKEKEKTGVLLEGVKAINPLTGAELPVYIADYVLAAYGTGAIMAVPGHDDRDGEFAAVHNLPVIFVVKDQQFLSFAQKIKKAPQKYILDNSEEFSGLDFVKGREAIQEALIAKGKAEVKTQFKLRDWSISRQRFWGAPIPVVYDPEGNVHLVEDEDLPVKLPDDVDFMPTGLSPLTYSDAFHAGVEEKYGKGWKREVDTLDTFMCSSWYFFRYIDPKNENAFASQEALKTWMPVDYYLGGPEHVNGHLLYSRFFTKVLFDAGIIDFDEPFLVHRHQGMVFGADGRKMSKRWGNIINPTDVVKEYGADTARLYLMFMGPLEQDKIWNDKAINGSRKFMERVFTLGQTYSAMPDEPASSSRVNGLVSFAKAAMSKQRFNVVIAELMKVLNSFEEKIASKSEWKKFLLVLSPFAPYITEELWELTGEQASIHKQQWPKIDNLANINEPLKVAVQINGKMRGLVELDTNPTEEEIYKKCLTIPNIAKHLDETRQPKIVYIPGKVINFIYV
jgi:leucyl-tRNA synthetase